MQPPTPATAVRGGRHMLTHANTVHDWRGLAPLSVAILVLASLSGPLTAQSEGGELVGRVISETTGKPLEGVLLTIEGTELRTLTSDAGLFSLRAVPTGRSTLVLRYLGATSRRIPVEVSPRQSVDLALSVNFQVIPVPELVVSVSEEKPVSKLTGFYRRMENSPGYFLTREQIDEANPTRMTWLLRRVPGLDIGAMNLAGRNPVTMSRRKGCRPDIYIDGARAPHFNIDQLPPRDVEALEVYRGNSEVPVRFKYRDRCGVIVIWTRDPGNAESFQ